MIKAYDAFLQSWLYVVTNVYFIDLQHCSWYKGAYRAGFV